MVPYFLLLGIPALLSLIKVKKDGKVVRTKAPIHLFFIIWIVLLSLRDISVGVDLKTYQLFFNQAAQVGWGSIGSTFSEPGYFFLAKVTQIFSGEYQFFLAVVALVTVIPLWRLYWKNSDHPYLSIILFATVAPFTMYFSGLRQVLAMTLGILAYHFTKKKKLFPFLLTVVVAFFFHQSAILLLVLYPVYRIKLSKNTAIIFAPIMAFVLIFNQQIFSILLRFLGDRYIERYSEYQSTGAYTVLILLVIFAVYCFVIPDEKRMDSETKGLRNILLLCVAIQCFAPVHSLAMRMNYYFLIFIPLLIPKIITFAKESNKKLARMSVIVMCFFFTVWFFFNAYTSADILQIYPYVPFWS